MDRESLDHGPFFRSLYYSLWLWCWNQPLGKAAFTICLFGPLLVFVRMHILWQWETMPSLRSNYCDFIISRYPWKKFWIEKPISPAIRKRIEEFSDKLLCLEKGLRGFHGKGRSSEPRKPSFFLCNVSLSFDHGCTFSEFLHVIHTRQGHWGGNLSPNRGGFHVIV